MIVLDTHAWIWVVAGDRTLSGAARSAIEKAAAAGAVLVPAIAVWEVAMLGARGRIRLAKPCLEWVDDALAAPGFGLAPLTPDVAIESAGIILVRSDPGDIAKIIRLSKATYRKMRQNLAWATGYNVIAIPLAMGILAPIGFVLPPAIGAAAMSASTVIVALNARRLKMGS